MKLQAKKWSCKLKNEVVMIRESFVQVGARSPRPQINIDKIEKLI